MLRGKVEICGVNTAQLPRLTAAQTRELLERARAGDKAAREELIAGNLRLVLSVVQRFADRGESMDDLFQVGVIGLIKAIDAFDLSQGVQFSTRSRHFFSICRSILYVLLFRIRSAFFKPIIS